MSEADDLDNPVASRAVLRSQLLAMTAARDDLLDKKIRLETCIERLNALLATSEAARGRMREALCVAAAYVETATIGEDNMALIDEALAEAMQ